MSLFRIPLFFNRHILFFKLMGCSRKGRFDMAPDLRQWAILVTGKQSEGWEQPDTRTFVRQNLGRFIAGYARFFGVAIRAHLLEPIEGYGKWDGKEIFGKLPRESAHDGKIAVLTRAHIYIARARAFQKHTRPLNEVLLAAEGLEQGIGMGELPLLKQATFSIWQSKDHMKAFAYKSRQHQTAIQKARQQGWFKEELFVRFRILRTF